MSVCHFASCTAGPSWSHGKSFQAVQDLCQETFQGLGVSTFPHFALCAACAPIPRRTAGNTSLPWVDSPGCALSSSLESPGGCREGSELSLTPSLPTVLPLPRFSRSVWLPEFPKLFPSPAFLGKKPQKLRDPGAPQRQENTAHVPGVPS